MVLALFGGGVDGSHECLHPLFGGGVGEHGERDQVAVVVRDNSNAPCADDFLEVASVPHELIGGELGNQRGDCVDVFVVLGQEFTRRVMSLILCATTETPFGVAFHPCVTHVYVEVAIEFGHFDLFFQVCHCFDVFVARG